ncbi:unnamed protein product [Choristocarpus tenellus]
MVHLAKSTRSLTTAPRRAGLAYLERWAGVRKGNGGHGEVSNSSTPEGTATSVPPVKVYGRSYLLPTLRMPPLSSGTAGVGWGENDEGGKCLSGGVVSKVEERRAYATVRESLIAKREGLSPIFSTGSPVVLDLAAVSQDGSPHSRPASKEWMVGAIKAVRDAGFLPVGITNASGDVLRLALEQGLPEVMASQAGLKTSISVGAALPNSASVPRSPTVPS